MSRETGWTRTENTFRAILTVHGKEQFLKQLEAIVESVRQNRMKIERRQQEEKSKRDGLNVQLSQLVDKARQYAKVLRDFQEVPVHVFAGLLGTPVSFLDHSRKRTSNRGIEMNPLFSGRKSTSYFIVWQSINKLLIARIFLSSRQSRG